MKILHLSHNGLPDMRVERAGRTGKERGHTIAFAGPFVKGTGLSAESFERFYTLPFNKFANAKIPSYWGALKRKLSQILSKYHPDVVHAHNIVAAKLASEFSIPFVYDDHEYASKQCKVKARIWKPNKMYIKWLWARWEKEVLRKTSATITVCKTIAEEHKRFCDYVFVAPNFPSLAETESLKLDLKNNKRLSSVYVGRVFSHSPKDVVPHRDVEGLLKIFSCDNVGTLTVIGDADLPSSQNVDSLGFLPHQAMMKELTQHDIGLLPWKRHWFHRYCNPNKPYEYAHAGLLVLTVSDVPCVIQNLRGYSVPFNDYDELKELLVYYSENLDEVRKLRTKIWKYAQKNLIWEKECEPKILHVYSKI